tara:strand:+ start:223419 stop:224045 length:627 start_codon:yes stop_codon:yes gene_type:complete
MKIYGHPETRSFRVYWTCHEVGIPYDFEPIKPKETRTNSEFMQLNPSGKVPALTDNGLRLFESAAICSYICQKMNSDLLPPQGTPSRAKVEQWLFFACAELEQPLWVSSKHQHILPEMYRTQEVESSCKYEFEHQTSVLSHLLADREFLVDDRFTLADLFVSHVLMWARAKGYMDKKNVNITDFMKRMREREGFKATKALAKKVNESL